MECKMMMFSIGNDDRAATKKFKAARPRTTSGMRRGVSARVREGWERRHRCDFD